MAQSEEDVRLRKEAVAWVICLQNSRITKEERRAFEVWQAQSPQHALIYRTVSRVWDSPELTAAASVVAGASPSWLESKPTFSLRWPVLAAACLVFVVLLADHFDISIRWQADYQTGVGERRTVELPDQSIATLNTQTALALSFDGTTRRIRLLKGEVFLKVQHDAERPFFVESADTTVRAVGTAFVVRTDAGGDRITVLEGAVEVESKAKTGFPVAVTAGSQIQTEPHHLSRPQAVDMTTASSWMRGRLVVQNVPFTQVLEELQRYHAGRILLMNRQVGHINVTGTYNVDDPAGALALLLQTVPLSTISLADRLVILF
ncbi:MAG: FecR family protein [Nitrospirae bacterium]|nr:FecR family protein [Nitrospirota bacterium]